MTTHEIVIAGFGGQGVMLMGQLLAYAGMIEGKNVSWMPSYGPEMRGGTANCSVIISDEPIGAPIVSEATAVVAMNSPSLEKFEPIIKTDGMILLNSSLIEQAVKRSDITIYQLPVNDIANGLGNSKVANIVALGALIMATHAVSTTSVQQAFVKMFAKRPELLAVNHLALSTGAEKIIELYPIR